jgi:putative ABC transport system permease protein
VPDWKEYVREHLPRLRVRATREAEIVEELAVQLEQAYLEARNAGHDEGEAERLAQAQLPDWQKLAADIEVSQPVQHRPPSRFWQGVPSEIRHAARVLRKSPAFTVVAIATLAIGIGGCTAIFSLIEAVLLRPIGYSKPDQLVMVWEDEYRTGFHKNVVAMADYLDWKARNHVFTDMSPILDQMWNFTGQGEPAVLKGFSVNDRLLPMLEVRPLLGRSFFQEETQPAGPAVAILSHKLWVERFGARREALGRKIMLDDKPYTIIGVLPADFPWLGKPLDVMTPAQFPKRDWRVHAGRFLRVVARLKPGVSLARAQGEMSTIARQLESEYPAFNKNWGVEMVPMSDEFAADAGPALWVLMGAVGLVLLIACSNVANLMLVRTIAREREIALRAALGATGQQLVRLLLTESMLLGLIGGFIGCALAYSAIRAVQIYGPQDVARLASASLNGKVLLFALVASLVTGSVFGLAPAITAVRLNLGATLKDSGRSIFNTARGERLRGVFVVAQIALALMLLTGATLLIRSLYRLSSVPTGFDPHNVLTGTMMVSGKIDDAKLGATCRQMIRRLRELPGVENASFITFLPFAGMGAATDFAVVGRPPYAPGQAPVTDVRVVEPGYFETMRIPLLRGRFFTDSDDRPDVPRGFVVNETLVRQTFGNTEALGQHLTVEMGDDKPGQIIGVVGDTKDQSLDCDVRPMVYYVQAQLPISFGSFVVRTRGKPELMAPAMTSAVREIQKNWPLSDVRTMDDRIGASIARMRFETGLLGAFATIAILLAVIGVAGVMAYSVEQRTREIGVRLALGAQPKRLQYWIAARGVRLAGFGLGVGLIAVLICTRALRSLLYGIKPNDPATIGIAAALLAAACLLASYIPARRTTTLDPLAALRRE